MSFHVGIEGPILPINHELLKLGIEIIYSLNMAKDEFLVLLGGSAHVPHIQNFPML